MFHLKQATAGRAVAQKARKPWWGCSGKGALFVANYQWFKINVTRRWEPTESNEKPSFIFWWGTEAGIWTEVISKKSIF